MCHLAFLLGEGGRIRIEERGDLGEHLKGRHRLSEDLKRMAARPRFFQYLLGVCIARK